MAAKAVGTASPSTPKAKVNMVKTEETSLVDVELIGSSNELVGDHTIHLGGFIHFIDGKATVSSTVADELRKLGMVK